MIYKGHIIRLIQAEVVAKDLEICRFRANRKSALVFKEPKANVHLIKEGIFCLVICAE